MGSCGMFVAALSAQHRIGTATLLVLDEFFNISIHF